MSTLVDEYRVCVCTYACVSSCVFAHVQVKVEVTRSCPTLCDPMEFSRPEDCSGRPFSSPGDLPTPGIEPRSPALQTDSLPAEPQGKPKNTGVGSLSLLQQIFPTQESNQGPLHCRQILHCLSYQRSISSSYVDNFHKVFFFKNFFDVDHFQSLY